MIYVKKYFNWFPMVGMRGVRKQKKPPNARVYKTCDIFHALLESDQVQKSILYN